MMILRRPLLSYIRQLAQPGKSENGHVSILDRVQRGDPLASHA